MPILDPTFNVNVTRFAPARILLTSEQFPTFEAMRDDYARMGILRVNTDFSDRTIFGDPSVNFRFRAWHDICHIQAGADFSAAGERAACALQQKQVIDAFGLDSFDAWRWCAILDAEVNGQGEYFAQHGAFPDDQYAFAVEYLRNKYGFGAGAPFPDMPKASGHNAYTRAASVAAMVPHTLEESRSLRAAARYQAARDARYIAGGRYV